MTDQEGRWDCHDHRAELLSSYEGTVYHLEKGQLCWWEIHWDCILYHPIKFKDRHTAQEWIENGCIATIQESCHSLHVGFSTKSIEKRN